MNPSRADKISKWLAVEKARNRRGRLNRTKTNIFTISRSRQPTSLHAWGGGGLPQTPVMAGHKKNVPVRRRDLNSANFGKYENYFTLF